MCAWVGASMPPIATNICIYIYIYIYTMRCLILIAPQANLQYYPQTSFITAARICLRLQTKWIAVVVAGANAIITYIDVVVCYFFYVTILELNATTNQQCDIRNHRIMVSTAITLHRCATNTTLIPNAMCAIREVVVMGNAHIMCVCAITTGMRVNTCGEDNRTIYIIPGSRVHRRPIWISTPTMHLEPEAVLDSIYN